MNMRHLYDSLKKTNGSMALEYVLVLSIGVAFFLFALQVFEPGRGFTADVGKPFVAFFQRVLTGISLPVP